MRKRKIIGLLIDFFTENYQAEILKGVAREAEKRNADLYVFCGGALDTPVEHHEPRIHIYSLIDKHIFDGLIVLGGSIGNYVTKEKLATFIHEFSPLPIVNIGPDLGINGIPCITCDNTEGFRKAISHLITAHGKRDIAFICGTEGNIDSQVRLAIYRETLEQHGLPFREELITPGDFYFGSGEKAIRMLVEERKVRFDALVGSNDLMAIEAVQELMRRGIHVPYDVAVIGFDDIEEAWFLSPPLSTVHQPFSGMGTLAVRTLFDILAGKKPAQLISMPSRPVYRRSCGCSSEMRRIIAPGASSIESEAESISEEQKENILQRLLQANEQLPETEARLLVDALSDSVISQKKQQFLVVFDRLITGAELTGSDMSLLERAVGMLIELTLPFLKRSSSFELLDSLSSSIRELVWEKRLSRQFGERKFANEISRRLHVINIELVTTFSLKSIETALKQELPKIGFSNFAIFLYNGKDGADLLFMQDDQKYIREEADKRGINVVKSLYARHRNDERSFSCVLMALYFKKEVLGCAMYNLIPLKGTIYESLSIQISGALMGARLIHELEDTQHEIIITLGDLVETRSHETGNHVRRVAEYSRLLAQAYGLLEKECDLLCKAAPLHDIGKVGIEDSILHKPGALNPEEWDSMKTHTTIGYKLLRSSERPILKAAAIIAYQHHEHYDGKGYPQELKGENIHIFGRIVCLADVFDALTTDREYKKKWPLRKTVNYIKSERGKLFDPALVDIFLTHLKKFLLIKRQFADKLRKRDML